MCLSCDGVDLVPVLPYPVADPEDVPYFRGCRIVRCVRCGLQQIEPVPSEQALVEYYGGVYRARGRRTGVDSARYPFDSPWYLSRGRAVCAFLDEAGWLPDTRTDVSVLDIGAGFGHVLFALSERMPAARLFATEPDSDCGEFLVRIGAQVLPQGATGLPATTPDGGFDLIVLTHVLEHLDSPTRVLAGLAGHLRPNGRVLIEVPNCPARFADQWETTPHLSFFERSSLAGCIERAGGRAERLVECGPRYERRTWRDFIPVSARRFVRAHLIRRREAAPDERDWSDPRVLPDPRFAEEGPDRFWLRALVAFS